MRFPDWNRAKALKYGSKAGRIGGAALLLLILSTSLLQPQFTVKADTTLSITPITWNVVGLDSNDVNAGPNNFPVGARVCNTGAEVATNVVSSFFWDSTNSYVNLRPLSLTEYTVANGHAVTSLAIGACTDFYYEVEVTRNTAAWNTTRRYHITAEAQYAAQVSTPTPREIYVERLISQNRNSTSSVEYKLSSNPAYTNVPAGGSMTLIVGSTYDIRLNASTATNGYEQIESFINFPNTIFKINTVATAYTANTGSDPFWALKLYGDGCRWENDPDAENYRACEGTGKYGGTVIITYNVTIIGGGGTSQTLSNLIYDFSGSSYHYNSDYGFGARIAVIVDPSTARIDKAFSPATTITGTSTLTFTITNPNGGALSGLNFVDNLPAGMQVAATPNASTTCGGPPTWAPSPGDTTLTFGTPNGGTIAATGTCTVRVDVTVSAIGTYNNTSNPLYVGTVNTGDTASASLNYSTDPGPPACTNGLSMAEWTFTSGTTAPSYQSPRVSTLSNTVNGVTSSGVNTGYTPPGYGNAWFGRGNWRSGSPYFEFNIDSSQFSAVGIQFAYDLEGNWATRRNNHLYVYSSTDGVTFNSIGDLTPIDATTWLNSPLLPAFFTGITSTTTFRIFAAGAQSNTTSAIYLDNIVITGCGVPQYPTIAKAFSVSPVAVGAVTRLTFTLTNTNNIALTGAGFSDALPAGVQVASPASYGGTCAATTWAPTAGATTLTFDGGTIPARALDAASNSCTVWVDVVAMAGGVFNNTSGYIYSTQTGTNYGAGGYATASLTAYLAPTIAKVFNPGTILAGGTSVLTFTITNPNTSLAMNNIAFNDTYPSTNITNTGVNNNGCGGTLTAAAGASSVSLIGGSLNVGASCTITITVTSAVAATYNNTSGAVSGDVSGSTLTGNTASASLVVRAVAPSISVLKQISADGGTTWSTFVGLPVGGSVRYRFTVENTGDVPLYAVNISDSDPVVNALILAGCTWSNPVNPLPVAVAANDNHISTCTTGAYTVTAAEWRTDTVTALGQYPQTTGSWYSDTASAAYATTGLTIVKTVTEDHYSIIGDLLHYTYRVTNTGLAPLQGPVTLSDDKASDESCPSVTTAQLVAGGAGNLDNFLDPGEYIDCTATYTIIAADISAGSMTNNAYATADGVTSNTDFKTVPYWTPTPTITDTWTETPETPTLTLTQTPETPTLTLTQTPETPTLTLTQTPETPTLTLTVTQTPETPTLTLTQTPETPTLTLTLTQTPETPTLTLTPTLTRTPETPTLTLTLTQTPVTPTLTRTPTLTQTPVTPTLTRTPTETPETPTLTPTPTTTEVPGRIEGYVYDDVNANGVQNLGELGIPGVTVRLYDAADNLLDTTTTNGSGYYAFNNLPAGNYQVVETDRPGYISTTNNNVPVTVTLGSTSRVDFGDRLITGSNSRIDGTVFEDANGNGIQDLGELGISGVRVELYNDFGTFLGFRNTAANGSYSFTGLSGGIYSVRETDPSGYISTTPNQVEVILGDDSTAVVNFGDQDDSGASIADPAVTKYGDPASATIGDVVTFLITVTNLGNATALNVRLEDTKPAFLDILAVNISPGPGFPVTISGNTITIYFGDLDPGETYTVEVVTRVNGLGAPPGEANNVAIYTDSTATDRVSNNFATAPLAITTPITTLPGTGFAPDRITTLPEQPEDKQYQRLEDLTLIIPKLGVRIPIVGVPQSGNGWDVTWLWNQAGWLNGTAFPSWAGNSVITAHVYLPSGQPGPFVNLHTLAYDDTIIVSLDGQQYIYKVRAVLQVAPDDLSILRHEELPWLTLITCRSYDEAAGSYRWRVAVRAVQVEIR